MNLSHPHSLRMNRWYGPGPTCLQRLLLTACLAPQEPALAAWRDWLARCSFDLEDAASMELAAAAVARLGVAAGESSQPQRCRGWSRREWFVSELAHAAAQQIEEECRRRSLQAVAIGDLATLRAGRSFAGRPFALRSLEIVVPGATVADIAALDRAARSGPAGDAFGTGSLWLSIWPSGPWRSPPAVLQKTGADGAVGIAAPVPAEQLAFLAAANWRRRPPGRLRWILEMLAVAGESADGTELGAAVAAITQRDDTTAEVQAALGCIAAFPGTAAITPVAAAVLGLRASLRSKLRCWRMTTRLEPGWTQLKQRISRRVRRPKG